MNPEEEFDNLHWSVIDVLREGRATPSYLAERTGESRQLVSHRLRDLRMGNYVEKIHKGLYELTEDPRAPEDGSDDIHDSLASDGRDSMAARIEKIEWDGQGGAKTDERVQALAAAAALLKQRGMTAPIVLREEILEEFDLDLAESSVQRLISDNLPKLEEVKTKANGQIYIWDDE